jgi:hypothetical protein
MNNEKLRKFIQEVLEEVLNEMTTTGAIDGYLTPNAFARDEKQFKKRRRHIANLLGYQLVDMQYSDKKDDDDEDTDMETVDEDKINEGFYQDIKGSFLPPKHKIGETLKNIKNMLDEIEKAVDYGIKVKNENNLSSESYWKRTQKAMNRINFNLVRIMNKMKDLQ